MILETAVASLGVTSPALTAATSAANAESALSRSASGGRSHAMAALRRGGARRSMHSLIAVMSPDLARSITLRVIASASPSNMLCSSTVDLLRAPRGRPAGLPLWPFRNFIDALLELRVATERAPAYPAVAKALAGLLTGPPKLQRRRGRTLPHAGIKKARGGGPPGLRHTFRSCLKYTRIVLHTQVTLCVTGEMFLRGARNKISASCKQQEKNRKRSRPNPPPASGEGAEFAAGLST